MIFFQVFFLQIIVTAVILLVLLEILRADLIKAALESSENESSFRDVMEVSVVTFAVLKGEDENRWKDLFAKKCPGATVSFIVNSSIWGGVVIKAGGVLIDHSLLTRVKYLFGQGDG